MINEPYEAHEAEMGVERPSEKNTIFFSEERSEMRFFASLTFICFIKSRKPIFGAAACYS